MGEEVFAPDGCPIDEILTELDTLEGFSCGVEQCPATGQAFLSYVVRRMAKGGRRANGNIHMDTVIPGRTMSINLYLQTPEGGNAGGELVLYPVQKGVWSRWLNSHFFNTVEMQNFYPDHTFYTEDVLSAADMNPIVHRPQAGDVVIIDPAYPHAARDFESSADFHRVSLQTFIQSS